MRKIVIVAVAALLLTACAESNDSVRNETTQVTVNFAPYGIEQMTRAAVSIADYCTKLDIWIYEGGAEVASFQQEVGSEGFGSVNLTLNITKSYTIYAVGHRVADGHASLADNIITFPADKVTHTFFVKQSFTPTKGMSLNLTMQRIVAQFSFNTTDQVPEWCKAIRLTASNVFDRWNVNSGGVHQIDRVTTINLTSLKDDGTVTCNIYAIVTDESTNHNILVEGLDANGEVQESHLFEDVPLRNNYRTIATGVFFSNAASSFSFLAEDWTGNIAYDF